jgi:hypothetical protein
MIDIKKPTPAQAPNLSSKAYQADQLSRYPDGFFSGRRWSPYPVTTSSRPNQSKQRNEGSSQRSASSLASSQRLSQPLLPLLCSLCMIGRGLYERRCCQVNPINSNALFSGVTLRSGMPAEPRIPPEEPALPSRPVSRLSQPAIVLRKEGKGVGREGEGYEGSDGRRWWLREARSQGRREERKSCGKETDAGRR